MKEVVELLGDSWGCEIDVAGETASPETIFRLAAKGAEEENDSHLIQDRHNAVQ